MTNAWKEKNISICRHHAACALDFPRRAAFSKRINPTVAGSPRPSFEKLKQECSTNKTKNGAFSLSCDTYISRRNSPLVNPLYFELRTCIRCVNVISCLPRIMSLTCNGGLGVEGILQMSARASSSREIARKNERSWIHQFSRRGRTSVEESTFFREQSQQRRYWQTHLRGQSAILTILITNAQRRLR